MQIYFNKRWLLMLLLLLSVCLLVTHGGRGGGGRGGGSRGGGRGRIPSGRRPTYRPAPAPRPSPRPAPAPAPKPAPKPSPKPPAPSPKPPAASPKPSAPDEPVVVKQPASNPNFKETNAAQGSAADRQPASNPNYKPGEGGAPGSAVDRQPASNPNYKPGEGGAPAGPPPPYAPQGQPAPNAAPGPPPPYQPNAPPGQRSPYPQQPGAPAQPPPYSGPPGRPPAYPGQSAPYPVQPGAQPYPQQPGYPGSYPRQPGSPGGYPQQPGYPGGSPQQPGMNRPYPVQPGYPQQPGMNRPYPVQPGAYPGGSRPYPQQPLGGNVWQPQSGRPAPAYMNYGGIPTGTNMNANSHKKKGFLGSLMGAGKPNIGKQNKYYGSHTSPYGVGGMGGGMGYRGRGGMGMGMGMGMGAGLLGTAAMFTILPYMAYRTGSMLYRPSYMPYHYGGYYGHGMHHGSSQYYDVYNDDYVGKCQRPLKKEHTDIRCKTTFDDIKCDAKCEDGYEFPDNITLIRNKCWHATGVWREKKNFPDCKPVCDNECLNGGECIRPGECKCPAEFRGSLCQFHFLKCDVRNITKGETHVGWVCNHSRNETVCKIRCKEPAMFESPITEEFRCTPEGKWTPDKIPHCVVKEKEGANSTSVK